jgi:hypothetical protein
MPLKMTQDQEVAAVLAAPVPECPNCGHGMDPHGVNPGGPCRVSGCECLLTPSSIHYLLGQKDKLDQLHHRVAEAIGAASKCWSNVNQAGTFRSKAAMEIAEDLWRDILETIEDQNPHTRSLLS